MRKIRCASALGVVVVATLTACGPPRTEAELEGQWIVELEHRGMAEPRVWGVLVFARDLPRYPDEREEFPANVEVGRAFVSLAAFGTGTASGPDEQFGQYPGADHGETMWGRIVGDDSVYLDLAPNINDFDPVLSGRIVGDTIIGQWTVNASGAAARSGNFRMVRVPRDEWSDSAYVRARRGTREWNDG